MYFESKAEEKKKEMLKKIYKETYWCLEEKSWNSEHVYGVSTSFLYMTHVFIKS